MVLQKYGEIKFNQTIEKTDLYLDPNLIPSNIDILAIKADIAALLEKQIYFEQLNQIDLIFDKDDLIKQAAISTVSDFVVGESKYFEIGIPNWTNNRTLTFQILNPNGAVIYSKSGLARNQLNPPVIILIQRPLVQASVLKCTLSGAVGGSGGIVTINSFVLRNGESITKKP